MKWSLDYSAGFLAEQRKMQWECLDYSAGFLAELSEALCAESAAQWRYKIEFWDIAIVLRQAAYRPQTKTSRVRLTTRLRKIFVKHFGPQVDVFKAVPATQVASSVG